MSQLSRFGGLSDLTPVVKNLLLLNILVFIACWLYPNLTDYLAMYYPSNPAFEPWQIITHMFTHGGFFHIFFNMYALYSFGSLLEHERVLGSKRFATLYLFSGLGAIAFHLAINAITAWNITGSPVIDYEQAVANETLASIYFSGVVGASGAIYGLLAGFGYLFPNTPLMFLFIPVPIKAKYMIPLVIIAYDIAFAQVGLDNVAHYAHIGGAIFGFLLVLFWNKTNRSNFF
ncbi:MAG TPA: rhomboid family intramembrane serine protease [Chitinophagales bacterium]|jgi:rhomboid-like protein|nr:rhomboid family intramembrane serine protease [Chitinophagales bacterium]HPA34974.1 rhomboid family intramembrane serine protease [Chitinophagales bacterium]HPW86021.1 rhomboid family intramembrane serine protease [Chitinophagales bacterium]HQO30675.1 rhomboid family intramembrane serine protease [Chitinophagales bacterium]HQO88352.1 rhomboid family intramembrane serine protease [Chitinophagales bacterium]